MSSVSNVHTQRHKKKARRMYYFEQMYIQLLTYLPFDNKLKSRALRSFPRQRIEARIARFQEALSKMIKRGQDCECYHVTPWFPLNKGSVLFLLRTMGEFARTWKVFKLFWEGMVYLDDSKLRQCVNILEELEQSVRRFYFFRDDVFDNRSMLKGKAIRSLRRARMIISSIVTKTRVEKRYHRYLATSGLGYVLWKMHVIGMKFQISSPPD